MRNCPVVRERLEAGRRRLHGWWFDIAQAEVSAYEEKTGRFGVIDKGEADQVLKRLVDYFASPMTGAQRTHSSSSGIGMTSNR